MNTNQHEDQDEPSDLEIRNAEKLHKAAFQAADICELIEAYDPVLVAAFQQKNVMVIGAILSQRFEASIDAMVEFSVYGRVLDKVKATVQASDLKGLSFSLAWCDDIDAELDDPINLPASAVALGAELDCESLEQGEVA
jgi:hypothetical protein